MDKQAANAMVMSGRCIPGDAPINEQSQRATGMARYCRIKGPIGVMRRIKNWQLIHDDRILKKGSSLPMIQDMPAKCDRPIWASIKKYAIACDKI